MSRKGCPNKVSKKLSFKCLNCKTIWKDYPSRKETKKFCSVECRANSKQHIKILKKRSMGNTWGSLKKITPEFRKKISIAHTGKVRPNVSKSKAGNKNPNWKGGISPEYKRIRRSSKFFQWRKKVFERDNYTCQMCFNRGGELHPDHIKQFAYYPELRFELSNGRTLCKECHMKTDTWGFKKHPLPEKQI